MTVNIIQTCQVGVKVETFAVPFTVEPDISFGFNLSLIFGSSPRIRGQCCVFSVVQETSK